jgi:hypothetical protein
MDPDITQAKADPHIYLDYIPSGIPRGATLSEENTDLTELTTSYTRSYHTLTKLSAEATASVAYGPASVSIALKAENETDLTTSLNSVSKNLTSSVTKWNTTLGSDEAFGTVVWNVDVKFGGTTLTIPYDQYLDIWDARTVQRLKNVDMTEAMKSMMTDCDVEPGNVRAHTPILFKPVVGKTCHHVQFLKEFTDSCGAPDGRYVLLLGGTQLVVCHHWNFNFIGGPDCDCDHVDGQNVLVENAWDVDPAYNSFKPTI